MSETTSLDENEAKYVGRAAKKFYTKDQGKTREIKDQLELRDEDIKDLVENSSNRPKRKTEAHQHLEGLGATGVDRAAARVHETNLQIEGFKEERDANLWRSSRHAEEHREQYVADGIQEAAEAGHEINLSDETKKKLGLAATESQD